MEERGTANLGGCIMKHVDADTVRNWLEDRTPVTVLDFRSDEDRA